MRTGEREAKDDLARTLHELVVAGRREDYIDLLRSTRGLSRQFAELEYHNARSAVEHP